MTPEQKQRFLNLACALSPENLTCDGELSRTAVKRKAVSLRRQWKELEKQVGRKVSEDEIWTMPVVGETLADRIASYPPNKVSE